jgi:hypothetical protein
MGIWPGRVILILVSFALGGSLTGNLLRKILTFPELGYIYLYIPVYIIIVTILWPLMIPLGQLTSWPVLFSLGAIFAGSQIKLPENERCIVFIQAICRPGNATYYHICFRSRKQCFEDHRLFQKFSTCQGVPCSMQ